MPRSYHDKSSFGYISLIMCVFALVLILLLSGMIALADKANNVTSFSEPLDVLTDGWLLTDSSGSQSGFTLPHDFYYGTDGRYTLEHVLPESSAGIASPALGFYSNYTDVKIWLDDELLLSFPYEAPTFTEGTGNIWLFVRLPADYAGRLLRIELRCQLGSGIPYIVKAPMLGAKATMLSNALLQSTPALIISSCMAALSLALTGMYLVLRRRLALGRSTLFLAIFAVVFSLYVFFETAYARMSLPNAHLVYFDTLALLALMPVPLVGFFGCDLGRRYRMAFTVLAGLCLLNLFGQMVLHFLGIINMRKTVSVTHLLIIGVIAATVICLQLADRAKCPGAHKKLLSSVPMVVGGCVDILLISLRRPSLNNSMWFVTGVSLFLLLQFGLFLDSYFAVYRRAIEAEVLRTMAYSDTLTSIANRNAYELRLKELSAGPVPEGLCCIVADINDLKHINDHLGHLAGDEAIKTVGSVLSDLIPPPAKAFRTGGDEFVVLLDHIGAEELQRLADRIVAETADRAQKHSLPLALAVGYGCYTSDDGNIPDFVRRVDTLMYETKHAMKAGV